MKYLNRLYLSDLKDKLKPRHTFSKTKSIWWNSYQDTYSYWKIKWKKSWKNNVFWDRVKGEKFTLYIFDKILFSKWKSKWWLK